MIAIVNYGMGNLFSIYNALDRVGAGPKIIADPKDLAGADGIVVPGVGAFGSCMDQLSGFEGVLRKAFDDGVPMFGICIGMQVLFEESEESPGAQGLGWIEGKVVRLPDGVMIPQMGWNSLAIKRPVQMFEGISDRRHVLLCALLLRPAKGPLGDRRHHGARSGSHSRRGQEQPIRHAVSPGKVGSERPENT